MFLQAGHMLAICRVCPSIINCFPGLHTNMMEVEQVKQLNVFLLGLSFMLVFTGFNTMSGNS